MASTSLPVITKSFSVILPIGTTVGKKSYPFDLPADYATVRGFYVVRNFGTDYLKITVKDSNGVSVLEPVNIAHLNGTITQLGTSLEIDKKFAKKTPFESNGRKMTLEIDYYGPPGVNGPSVAVQDFDFVYECDQEPLVSSHKM